MAKTIYYGYCDGACTKLGIGAAGGFLMNNGKVKLAFSFDHNSTTNNQMEMTAVIISILGFLEIAEEGDVLEISTDSQYTQKGITEWSKNWVKKNWVSSSGQPVMNKELWLYMLELIKTVKELGYGFRIKWVRGHNGNAGNEVSDFLASRLNPDREHEQVLDDIEAKIKLHYSDRDELSDYRPEIYSAVQVGFGDGDLLEAIDLITENTSDIFC